jgi:protein-S-isoprenylcysteine O-methyltransferase Ste14
MFLLVRVATYATLFIGLVLIYVPARLLSSSGIVRPATMDAQQVAGMVLGAAGAVIALWCVVAFATAGNGTPAPFDPPRRLVTQGPYRFARNPMYMGAGLALAGGALFYGSLVLLVYAGIFLVSTHLFAVWYEEPALRRTFGVEYDVYCRQVGRWWPHRRTGSDSNAS